MTTTTCLGSGDASKQREVLLGSKIMGEHFAGTDYARYFLSHEETETLHGATAAAR